MTNLADSAIAVIGKHLNDDRNTAGTVAFKADFFVGCAFQFAGAALDCALNVVSRHILGLGSQNRGSKSRVAVRIAAPVLRGDGDFLDQTRKGLAALGIERALLV